MIAFTLVSEGTWAGEPVRAIGQEPAREVKSCPAPAFEGEAAARLANPSRPGIPSVTIAFSPENLPFLQMWRRTEARLNIYAIEPISHRLAPRAELETSGELRAIAPGAVLSNRVRLAFDAS